MKTIQNSAAGIFILAVGVLSIISILGIWEFFARDVISKSFQTLGLLAVVAVVVMVAGKFVKGNEDPNLIIVPNPIFKTLRVFTLGVLIVSAVLLAFLGVCAIWDVITDSAVLYKSLSSLAILAFSSFVIVMICLEREDSPLLKRNGKSNGGAVLITIVVAYLLFTLFGAFS